MIEESSFGGAASKSLEPNNGLPHSPKRLRGAGQMRIENQTSAAGASQNSTDGRGEDQTKGVDHMPTVDIPSACGILRELYHRRQDMLRAETRLTLQMHAQCRRLCGGDKDEAQKLYKAMLKVAAGQEVGGSEVNNKPALAHALAAPFLEARTVIAASRKKIEKEMERDVRKLPVYPWVKSVKGLGDLSFAAIVGATTNPEPGTWAIRTISDYATVSRLWKRLGLAVIGGERQRRKTGDVALEHGYSPERRAVVWVLADSFFRLQGNGAGASVYRLAYDGYKARKESESVAVCMACNGNGHYQDDEPSGRGHIRDEAHYHAATAARSSKKKKCRNCDGTGGPAPWGRSKKHRHNAALRYMSKMLIKDLWAAWRAAV